MALNLRQMQCFVAVAEELHFGRAAQRLSIAQPPLSQMIRRLEDELQVKLLHRNKRNVDLTGAGRAFLIHARRALAEVSRARDAAERAGRGETGLLLLGVVPSGDSKLFVDVLRGFSQRYPQVRVVLHSLSTAAQVEGIRSGHLDAGFVRLPVRAPRLDVRVVSRETLVVALPEDHVLAASPAVPLAALAEEPHIMFPRHLAPDFYDTIVSLFYEAGHSLDIAHEAEHIQMQLSLIAGGFGVSLLPSSTRDFQLSGVVFRAVEDPVPDVEMALAYRQGERAETLDAFLDVVAEVAPVQSVGSPPPGRGS